MKKRYQNWSQLMLICNYLRCHRERGIFCLAWRSSVFRAFWMATLQKAQLAMTVRVVTLICITGWLLAGCVSSKYVERKQYLLEIPKNATTVAKCPVMIEPTLAIPPFDQLDFLYRINSDRYLVDYYNGFLIPSAEQLDVMLKNYFRVSDKSDGKLQVELTELYADYRDHDRPQAVISLRFYLTSLVARKTAVLLDRKFQAKVALKAKSTNSLLQAWNQGLQEVLVQGVRSLNRVRGLE